MFGDLSVFARPVVSATPEDAPKFPLYLLPTFSLPFRRRRRSQPQAPSDSSEATTPDESAVPSLSTSPGSEIDDPVGSPSPFPDLSQFDYFLSKSETSPLPPSPTGARLARAQPDTIRCKTCATDLAFISQIVSKGFTGRHGRAYLVAPPSTQSTPSCPGSPVNDNISPESSETDLINIRVGRPENRQLVTGAHVVADIWCVICDLKLGWKYVDAREPAQKYKVGKFILETQRAVVHRAWEDVHSPGDGKNDNTRSSRWSKPSSARVSSDANASSSSTPSRVSEESDLQDDDDDGEIVFDSEDEDECEDIFAGVWDPEVVAKRRKGKVAVRRTGAV